MKQITTIFMLIALIFLFSCTNINQTKCEEPMVMLGNTCCLDDNSNNVCDSDEVKTNEITSNVIAPTCPDSCDDFNSCTTDSCSSATNYECTHTEIVPCCGNDVCEEGENFVTCEDDCESTPSIEELNVFINTLTKTKEYAFIVEQDDKYSFIDRHYNTTLRSSVFEIKDKDKYLLSSKDFKSFINKFNSEYYNDVVIEIDYGINKEQYDYYSDLIINYIQEDGYVIVAFSDVYIFYEYKIGTNGKEKLLDDIYLDTIFYVACSPDKFLSMTQSPSPARYQNFVGKTLNQTLQIVNEQIDSIVLISTKDANKLSTFCQENSDFSYAK